MPKPTKADFFLTVSDAGTVVLRIQEECGVDFRNGVTRAIAAVVIVRACAAAHAGCHAKEREAVRQLLGECTYARGDGRHECRICGLSWPLPWSAAAHSDECPVPRVEALMGETNG